MAHEPYFREGKKGGTALLFIHGFLGSPDHFIPFYDLCPDGVAIRNILLAGHGGTTKEFGRASMREWKKQVSGEVDKLAARYNKIIIAGHSMGTLFAMEESLREGKVKALFLLQSPLRIAVKPTAAINSIKSIFGRIDETDEVGKAYDQSHSVELTLKVWQYIPWIPRYLELFKESKKGRETIKKVTVPCRIFQSRKDELVPIKSVRDIPRKENIRLEVLPHSYHFIYGKEDEERIKKAFSELF